MSITNSHIQGDLTISQGPNEIGVLNTNFIKETNSGNGINLQSTLKSEFNINLLNDLGGSGVNINLSDSPANSLDIINNVGGLVLNSSGNKGITISQTSGDVLITSTTDSIDQNTGSLITTGGAVIGKTLYVKEDINALDGIHNFTNTNSTDNVLNIKNTSNGGYSSAYFKSSTDQAKLEIGYGNSTVSSPFTSTSYIQSINGSELLFRGNSNDSFKISTDGSITFYNTTPATSITTGGLKINGGVAISNATNATSTTSGGALSIGGGALVSKDLVIGGTLNLNISPTPSAPTSGIEKIYIDDNDGLLKSKNSINVVTTYQPTTTKGDLVTHNGTTQTRLPASTDGYVLTSNSLTSTGLEWVEANITSSGFSGASTSNKYFLDNINSSVIIEKPSGSFFNFTYPLVQGGSSCNFFHSKSRQTIVGTSVRLNSNTSLSTFGQISSSYPAYRGLEISKAYTEANGNYVSNTNEFFDFLSLTLTGTTWTTIISSYIGCFCLSIKSVNDGPAATFFVVKNSASLNSGNVTRLSSSQGTSNCNLEIRWQSLSFMQIRKTNSNDDGGYTYRDNFQDTTLTTTVLLIGTTRSYIDKSIFDYYQNKSFMVKVSSTVSNSPCSIFTISKNSFNRSGNVTNFSSPGVGTNERLNLFWDQQQTLSLSKNGVNYNGTYTLVLTKLT